MLNLFRAISLIEGLSLVLLLFVAMPLKYYFSMPVVVTYVGMMHGMLFMAYVFLSVLVSDQQKWSVFFWLYVLLCSLMPFACLFLERQLGNKLNVDA
ncbi:MAG: DUF3817 domain-containing protein [Pseudomonadales bacterium]|nr:DUF3817 domain-containing protein [Pseudomonadales bacterium]